MRRLRVPTACRGGRATVAGLARRAARAAGDGVDVAGVIEMPHWVWLVAAISWMRLFALSAMYRLPDESATTADGVFKSASEAWPLSPVVPAVPVPARVVMFPAVSDANGLALPATSRSLSLVASAT